MTSYNQGEKPRLHYPAHVLVASDEDTTRIAISIILSAAGFQVHEAKDRAGLVECLESLSARGIKADLLILDVEMEGMRGMRLLESVRASGGSLPAILIVGLNSRHLVASVAIGDRTCILPKPFDPEELEQAVASILSGASEGSYTDET